MYRKLRLHAYVTALVTVLALSCIPAAAQTYLGLYSSPKGFGISAAFPGTEESEINHLYVYADIYGLPTNRTGEVGIVATYTKDYIFSTIETDHAVFDFFAGAGASAGYVHDYERGFFSSTRQPLARDRSIMAALSGDIGVHAEFGRRLSLELSFITNLGIAMRSNRSNGAMLFSFYKNGAFQTLYPQISLYFRL